MRNINSTIDYITKDYEGFRDLMIQSIPKYAPEWTDTSQSDMGIVLIELLAQGLDVLSYYQDKTFQENFLATAKTRRSVLNLCKLLGYDLKSQVPAKYKVKFTKSADYTQKAVKIPKGTKLGTDPLLSAQIVFETDEDLIINIGETEGTVSVTHGQTIHNDLIGVGDNSVDQRYKLTYADVLKDTIEVRTQLRTDNGGGGNYQQWVMVDDFLSSDSTHRHFTVETDEFNNCYVVFGNGVTGMCVPSNYNIHVSYRVGGGKIGNVGAKTINTYVDNEIAGISKFTNDRIAYQQGEDLEDINEARLKAPARYRTLNRAITRQDFEDIVLDIDGVAKCKVIEGFNIEREVNIYVAPEGYGRVSSELKELIAEKLTPIKLVHDKPVVKDVEYCDFDITLTATIGSNFVNEEVKGYIEEVLKRKFKLDDCDFGQTIYKTDIFRYILNEVGQVRNIEISSPPSDHEVEECQIPRLRHVRVSVEGGIDLDD